jgi:hypothetical protein
VLILFGATIFVSASLLFLVQPMFARMALPLLGGAPAVWNTAMVFYQAVLLAGYAYAHVTMRWLGARRQAGLHLLILLVPLLVLPIALPAGWIPPGDTNPIPWLLALLAAAVGLPFFAVSATSPALQAWLAATGHPAARDPYMLYAASNVGSMLALLAYPVLVERFVHLDSQSRLWAWGYGILVGLAAGCALALWRAGAAHRGEEPGNGATTAPLAAAELGDADRPITPARRARWVLLAAVPSSLMLSVTTYLSTDIAAIPLLWIVPLAIYLLTFALVFGRRRLIPHRVWVELLPVALLPLVLVLVARANEPLLLVIPTHLVVFFVAAMVCHGELAQDRPDPRHLTAFYLRLAVGGGRRRPPRWSRRSFTNVLSTLVLARCSWRIAATIRLAGAPARCSAALGPAWAPHRRADRGPDDGMGLEAAERRGPGGSLPHFLAAPVRFALGLAALPGRSTGRGGAAPVRPAELLRRLAGHTEPRRRLPHADARDDAPRHAGARPGATA